MGRTPPFSTARLGEIDIPAPRSHSLLVGTSPVTNQQFAAFVRATGHVTQAERDGWSFVFRERIGAADWWDAVTGASWRFPPGPGQSAEPLAGDPVVHVSAQDATSYCAWAGTRLPTEAEWLDEAGAAIVWEWTATMDGPDQVRRLGARRDTIRSGISTSNTGFRVTAGKSRRRQLSGG